MLIPARDYRLCLQTRSSAGSRGDSITKEKPGRGGGKPCARIRAIHRQGNAPEQDCSPRPLSPSTWVRTRPSGRITSWNASSCRWRNDPKPTAQVCYRFGAPFFLSFGRFLMTTMWRGSSVPISPSLSTSARERGAIKIISGCRTAYSSPSEVRTAKGVKPPPATRCRIRSMFMLRLY